MNFLAPVLQWISSFTSNFGIAVALFSCLYFFVTIPIRLLTHKNKQAKQECLTALRNVRRKYNASTVGVHLEDTPDMPKRIKKMTYEQRKDAMAKEISEIYKKHGYHIGRDWVLRIIALVLIVFVYSAIRAVTPEGFWMFNLKMLSGTDADIRKQYFILIAITVGISFVSSVISALLLIWDDKKLGEPIKPTIIAAIISIVISMALSVWISVSVTAAIAVALASYQLLVFIDTLLERLLFRD